MGVLAKPTVIGWLKCAQVNKGLKVLSLNVKESYLSLKFEGVI